MSKTKLTFHGQACFDIETGDGTRIWIDPFLSGNPAADIGPSDVTRADYVLFTHGHSDHIGDGFEIAERTGALIISTYEIVSFAKNVKSHTNAHPLHIGGGYDFPFGRVKMTSAAHGGGLDIDESGRYTTVPGGFLITLDGTNLYHAGDTGLIADMQLLRGQVDIALLPIGDNFTMGPEDAVRAVQMIEPKVVIPMHYNTWDIITQDPAAFAEQVGPLAKVVILESGELYEF